MENQMKRINEISIFVEITYQLGSCRGNASIFPRVYDHLPNRNCWLPCFCRISHYRTKFCGTFVASLPCGIFSWLQIEFHVIEGKIKSRESISFVISCRSGTYNPVRCLQNPLIHRVCLYAIFSPQLVVWRSRVRSVFAHLFSLPAKISRSPSF